jgi:hypothetical protein
MFVQTFVGPWQLLQFLDPIHSQDSLDGGSARRKASTYAQGNTNRIDARRHVFSGIRTHDPSVRATEDSSCLSPRGHCDRLTLLLPHINLESVLHAVNVFAVNSLNPHFRFSVQNSI